MYAGLADTYAESVSRATTTPGLGREDSLPSTACLRHMRRATRRRHREPSGDRCRRRY